MNLSIDKPQLFENDEVDVITIENAIFEVDEYGDLHILNASTKTLIGYFPHTKWDCVYPTEEE